MAADAAISAAVAVSGLVILFTDWSWLDPLMSLVVVSVIVYGTWGLGRDAMRLAIDAVPPASTCNASSEYLADIPGVDDVHDLHVWALSTTDNALSAHLVMRRAIRATRRRWHRRGLARATFRCTTRRCRSSSARRSMLVRCTRARLTGRAIRCPRLAYDETAGSSGVHWRT